MGAYGKKPLNEGGGGRRKSIFLKPTVYSRFFPPVSQDFQDNRLPLKAIINLFNHFLSNIQRPTEKLLG